MAVGSDEYQTPIDRHIQVGVALSLSAAVLGVLSGSKRLSSAGAGGACALILLKLAGRRR